MVYGVTTHKTLSHNVMHTSHIISTGTFSIFESSITIEGQITLPKAIRDSLAVKAGDKVRYVILDEGVLIMPVRPTSRLFGSLKYEGPPVSLEDIERAIAEG